MLDARTPMRILPFALLALATLHAGPVSAAPGEVRLKSPQGKLDVIFRPIDADHARTVKAVKGAHGPALTQYRIEFWPAGSSVPVNIFDYVDGGEPSSPHEI